MQRKHLVGRCPLTASRAQGSLQTQMAQLGLRLLPQRPVSVIVIAVIRGLQRGRGGRVLTAMSLPPLPPPAARSPALRGVASEADPVVGVARELPERAAHGGQPRALLARGGGALERIPPPTLR